MNTTANMVICLNAQTGFVSQLPGNRFCNTPRKSRQLSVQYVQAASGYLASSTQNGEPLEIVYFRPRGALPTNRRAIARDSGLNV